jgi:hypothetical protein
MALQPHAQTMAASALEQGVQRESGMDQAAVAARTPATAHALAPAAAARREPATRPDAATQAAIAAERGYLLRMALRQLRDRMLAGDVVHDTLLAALQGAARLCRAPEPAHLADRHPAPPHRRRAAPPLPRA